MTLIHKRLTVSVSIRSSSLSCQPLDRFLFDFRGRECYLAGYQ